MSDPPQLKDLLMEDSCRFMYEVTESKRAESKGEERPSLSTAAMPHKGWKVRNKEGRKQTKSIEKKFKCLKTRWAGKR